MAFAGESFLQVPLPKYDEERSRLTIWLISATIFWILVYPMFTVAKPVPPDETKETEKKDLTDKSNGKKKIKSKQKVIVNGKEVTMSSIRSDRKEQPQVPLSTTIYSVLGLMVTILTLMMAFSPHNYYTSRRVFHAPLLTPEECDRVVAMAKAAAERNYQTASASEVPIVSDDATPEEAHAVAQANRTRNALLEEPTGWQKTRHNSYPTTDLNFVTDPFQHEDRVWLSNLLNQRLTTQLARFFGLTAKSIRANDLFVVRYDAERRAHLANHTDDSDISFNVLLTDDFEGGGTRFWNRITKEPFAHVHPTRKGEFLTHSALIHHEGYQVSKGTRMILVGFLSVDRVDPFTGADNGLSWFATWGNWAWLHVKFKEAYMIRLDRLAVKKPDDKGSWTDHPFVRQLLVDLVHVLEATGDVFGTHAVERVVAPEQAREYLGVLDQAAPPSREGRSSWFKGQQLKLDVDGSIAGEWQSRKKNAEAFEEL